MVDKTIVYPRSIDDIPTVAAERTRSGLALVLRDILRRSGWLT